MKCNLLKTLGAVAATLVLSSCATPELKSGDESLTIRVMPQGEWKTAKVYLNDQYVDTAVPGADQRMFKVAPGRYKIRLETDNHDKCEATATVVGEMRGKNYFEFHPQQIRKLEKL